MSIWMTDPGDGRPDATDEELAAEPEGEKGVRVLRCLRAFNDQERYTLSAIKLDGKHLVIMKAEMYDQMVAELLKGWVAGDE